MFQNSNSFVTITLAQKAANDFLGNDILKIYGSSVSVAQKKQGCDEERRLFQQLTAAGKPYGKYMKCKHCASNCIQISCVATSLDLYGFTEESISKLNAYKNSKKCCGISTAARNKKRRKEVSDGLISEQNQAQSYGKNLVPHS